MLLYLVIGFAALGLILLCLKGFTEAEPATVKKIVFYLVVTIAVAVLLRFGLLIFAAMVAVLPFVRQIIALLLTYRQLKGFWGNKTGSRATSRGAMSEEEAREILGVSKHASKEEIKEAYQRLMKKNHPDAGGSKHFAAQLNQAKDVLLKGK